MRRTKIIATFGPSIADPEVLKEICEYADAIRINLAHGTWDESEEYNHVRNIQLIQKVSQELKKPVAILVDLKGNKIRIGGFINHMIELENDSEINVIFTDQTKTNNHEIIINANYCFPQIEIGDKIFLDDGLIQLIVLKIDEKNLTLNCKVEHGGMLKSNKGFEVENKIIHRSGLGDEDKSDIRRLASLNIDWIALSFVQKPNDIKELRKICANKISIMAKIEKPSALDHINKIADLADGIMIARGDLGVELPIESVPGWQKKIIRVARVKGKPVVVSTQMLESMTSSLTPTRAEVSDVANAVFEGADAIMLSAESASGDYPVETVKMMNKIAINIEKDSNYNDILSSQLEDTPDTTPDAIAVAAKTLADELSAPIIVCYTESGSTGIKVSRVRPSQTILTITPVVQTARKLSLAWGVLCFLQKDESDLEHMIKLTKKTVKKSGLAIAGDKVVITAGLPLKVQGTTNLIRVTTVK